MSTRNNKGDMIKIEEPISAETFAEQINKLVETSVAEIETQPVNEEFVEIPDEEELVENIEIGTESQLKTITGTESGPFGEPVTTPRKKKTFAQMTACEMNIYNKTGIIPFL